MGSATKPSIALVAHDVHSRGGMERVCADLIRETNEEFDFTVISVTLDPDLRHLVRRWIRVQVPTRPMAIKFTLFWLHAGARLRQVNADLIHTVGALIPNRADLAAVHFCHAGFVEQTRALAPKPAPLLRRVNTATVRLLALAAERWCYRPTRLRALAAVSRGVQAELRKHYPNVPVYLTPNGVDHEKFHPDPHARRDLRSDAGFYRQMIALFVGGDWDRKGLAIVLEALARARAAAIPFHLWVLGTGDQARFGALAAQLGVKEAVSFLGPRRDVERFMAAADIFVLPSAYETFGLVAFEAAASGLPIIATPVHGISELLAGEDAGILVDRDPRVVSDAMQQLADNTALRSRLGQGAKRQCAPYSKRASAASTAQAYRVLLGRGAEPA